MPSFDCLLCGISGPQVRPGVVEWRDQEPHRFDVIPRCTDHAECRARVEAEGEPWPLVDARSEKEIPA